jgi:hypothetical protein
LRKHLNKVHRGFKSESHHVKQKPHIIPEDATNVKILGVVSTSAAIPPGFSRKDLPLFKASYTLKDGSTFKEISSYPQYRERFAKEFCQYFISRTTLIKPTLA